MTHGVPYARLRAAERDAATNHPNADRVKAIWTPSGAHDVLVEVWQDGRADVVPA